jgi:hypothetical protein
VLQSVLADEPTPVLGDMDKGIVCVYVRDLGPSIPQRLGPHGRSRSRNQLRKPPLPPLATRDHVRTPQAGLAGQYANELAKAVAAYSVFESGGRRSSVPMTPKTGAALLKITVMAFKAVASSKERRRPRG